MASDDKELKAISTMIKELEGIVEERRAPAIQYVIDRMNISGISIGAASDVPTSKDQMNPAQTTQGQAKSIKEFIEQKNPQNNYQLVACLGYYMEKKENVPEFGAKEINDANKRARRPAIANTTRDIKNAQHQYKFVTSGSEDRRKKMLTSIGEKVVDALPDQEQVKIIVREARKGILKRKKSNSKKDTK